MEISIERSGSVAGGWKVKVPNAEIRTLLSAVFEDWQQTQPKVGVVDAYEKGRSDAQTDLGDLELADMKLAGREAEALKRADAITRVKLAGAPVEVVAELMRMIEIGRNRSAVARFLREQVPSLGLQESFDYVDGLVARCKATPENGGQVVLPARVTERLAAEMKNYGDALLRKYNDDVRGTGAEGFPMSAQGMLDELVAWLAGERL